jgi:hypothetical protein
MLEHGKIKRGNQICGRKASSRMAGTGRGKHLNNRPSDLPGSFPEFFYL